MYVQIANKFQLLRIKQDFQFFYRMVKLLSSSGLILDASKGTYELLLLHGRKYLKAHRDQCDINVRYLKKCILMISRTCAPLLFVLEVASLIISLNLFVFEDSSNCFLFEPCVFCLKG